jgi:hypothetical protein
MIEKMNSSKNQEIKSKFVGIHVYACVSSMVAELQELNSLDYEKGIDIIEYISYYGYSDEFGEMFESDRDEKIEEIESKIEELEEIKDYYFHKIEMFRYRDNEYFSIFVKKHETAQKFLDIFQGKIETLEDMEFNQIQEIYEYWIVSDFLAGKLEEQGEIIIENYGLTIWGRQTTGQAILLDSCISQVCYDMEILENQSIQWLKDKN